MQQAPWWPADRRTFLGDWPDPDDDPFSLDPSLDMELVVHWLRSRV